MKNKINFEITEHISLDLNEKKIQNLFKEIDRIEEIISFRTKELKAIKLYNYLRNNQTLYGSNIYLTFDTEAFSQMLKFIVIINDEKNQEKDFDKEAKEIEDIVSFSEKECQQYYYSGNKEVSFVNNNKEREKIFQLLIGKKYKTWLKEKRTIELSQDLDEKLEIKTKIIKKNKI